MKSFFRLICCLMALLPAAGKAAWELQNSFLTQPYLPGVTFNAVWGTGRNDIFVAGTEGTILHFNGSEWQQMESGTKNTLYAVSGSGPANVFAVGEKGTILHYDGSRWRPMFSGTQLDLTCIWVFSGTDVFAAGKAGKILRFDGTHWLESPSGSSEDLAGLWGSSATDLFAVGSKRVLCPRGPCYGGVILHFDGNRWETMTVPEYLPALTSIWGDAEKGVFAFPAYDNSILHYDGRVWQYTQSQLVGTKPWGSSTGRIFTLSPYGEYVYRFDGSEKTRYFDGNPRFTSLWGSSDDHVIAVGNAGGVYRFDGDSWTRILGTPEEITSERVHMWGASTTDVYAIHADNTIRHFDGSRWSVVYQRDGYSGLNRIWGSGPNDIHVVGGKGLILHYNGSRWAEIESATSNDLTRLWGGSATDVYAADDWGAVLHYDGASWKEVAGAGEIADEYFVTGGDGTFYRWRGIWGTSPGNLYTAYMKVVEPGKTVKCAILHYDGQTWTEMPIPQKLFQFGDNPDYWVSGRFDFSGSAGNDVYLLEHMKSDFDGRSFSARILCFDGVSWKEIWTPDSARPKENLFALWGNAATGLFSVGENVILHFDGSKWDRISLDKNLSHLNGTSSGNVFAGASFRSGVLHFDGEGWTTIADNPDSDAFKGIWGAATDDVFAVGGEGMIFHYDGSAWLEMSVAADETLYDVWGRSGNDVFAVGEWGTILHFDGSEWHRMESGTRNLLTGVWGDSAENVYVAGYDGIILHYDGTNWTLTKSGSFTNFTSIWGRSANDVHVAGNDSLLRFNGTSWEDETGLVVATTPCTSLSFRVFGSGDAIYLSNKFCDYGSYYRYTGNAWEYMNTGYYSFGAIDGPLWIGSETDIFALSAGYISGYFGGYILRSDGSGWTYEPQNGLFNDLWGTVGDDVFAAGEDGVIMRLARPDRTPPAVTLTDPSDGAKLVDPTTDRLVVTFSEPIDISTVNETTFTVRGPSGVVDGDISLGSESNQLLFNPSENLQPGTAYSVTISAGAVRDMEGNSMPAASWTFTTKAGTYITPDLWISAEINTVDKGMIEAIWKEGGQDVTARGDRVIWGYFYANPADVDWGDPMNPDLFVKIWFDVDRHVYISYLHVSVPEISVFSRFNPHSSWQETLNLKNTTDLDHRYAGHYYFYLDRMNGYEWGYNPVSESQLEDGASPSGTVISPAPPGVNLIHNLRIGAIIKTADKRDLRASWKPGGQGLTARGDTVLWGYFYADPAVMSWGSEQNPDLFVKIWFDVNGPVYVDYYHASVPDICVYSDLPSEGPFNDSGITLLKNRLVEHRYNIGPVK